MNYNQYIERINATTDRYNLESILKEIEDDFENINERQYEDLRYLIIKKIYL